MNDKRPLTALDLKLAQTSQTIRMQEEALQNSPVNFPLIRETALRKRVLRDQEETYTSTIAAQYDIIQVAKHFITLEKQRATSSYLRGYCPLHENKTMQKEFTVSPKHQCFYSYCCHKGGDVVKLVSLINKCSLPEAEQWLLSNFKGSK